MDSWKNDRAVIEAALDDPDPDNKIAKEIAEAIVGFGERISKHADRINKFPDELLLTKPKTVFDDFVIRMTLQEIADETGVGIKIFWVPNEEET